MKIKNIIRLTESIEQFLIGFYIDKKKNLIFEDTEIVIEIYLFKRKVTYYIIYG